MPSGNHDEYDRKMAEAEFICNKIIVPATKELFDKTGYKLEREVDNLQSGAIDKRIVEKLYNAEIVIADLTGRNPNVFLN